MKRPADRPGILRPELMPSCSAPRPATPRFALLRWLEIRHITLAAAAAVILILAAVALRLVGLGVRDLFRDEAASWLLSHLHPAGHRGGTDPATGPGVAALGMASGRTGYRLEAV
jgi:hypothetical protein